jgi:hypothetical protein
MRTPEADALLRSRCDSEDWRVWVERSREDAVWSITNAHRNRVRSAADAMLQFCSGPRGYIGISWGKDSCAVLLLSIGLSIDWPLVYVSIDPVSNPDCSLTRDAWLDRWPALKARYHEIHVPCVPKPSTGRYDTNKAYKSGFAQAASEFGDRYLSGVRASESGSRGKTMQRNGRGSSSDDTGRPIGWLEGRDVFAILQDEFLHPAYPCTLRGAYDRERVRVNNLCGLYGEGHGRREWEQRYYGDAIRDIRRQHARDVAAMR